MLGEHVFDFFLRNKRAEWEEYRREVTPYERQRYLPRPRFGFRGAPEPRGWRRDPRGVSSEWVSSGG